VTVLILDRPRHAELIRQIREAGARIRMISDGDVGGAIETAKPGAPVDVLMGGGVGGSGEGGGSSGWERGGRGGALLKGGYAGRKLCR
jgi:fructose-1,6-bisphosphatase/sedoheptulose 1,7-bisphosphatase-like protein